MIRKPGDRKIFTLDNVERIAVNYNKEVSRGNISNIYWGKVKFKGKQRPLRVLLKYYRDNEIGRGVERRMPGIVARLNKSSASHPKMEVVDLGPGFGCVVVMEPFFRGAKSKFRGGWNLGGDLAADLDVRNREQRELFKQIVQQTAHLSKAGLSLGQGFDYIGLLRADAFNFIELKDGSKKVIVSDVDTLHANDNVSECWSQSLQSLLKINTDLVNPNRKVSSKRQLGTLKEFGDYMAILLEVVNEVQKEMNMPKADLKDWKTRMQVLAATPGP